jgi:hypothetical protein
MDIFKKYIKVVIVFIVTSSLIACSNDSDDDNLSGPGHNNLDGNNNDHSYSRAKNEALKTNDGMSLPSFSSQKINKNFVGRSIDADEKSEKEMIADFAHYAAWIYYTDEGLFDGAGEDKRRWYISHLTEDSDYYGDIYSLMRIEDGVPGWATVANDAASIEIDDEYIYIYANDGLDENTSTTYYDAGLKKYVTNKEIISDRKKIQGDEVIGKWYFFYLPETDSWYISTTYEYEDELGRDYTTVHKFSYTEEGRYDWINILGEEDNYKAEVWDKNGDVFIKFNPQN